MSGRPRILCLGISDFARDPRITRQLDVLREYGDTWSAGLGPPAEGGAFLLLQQRSRAPLQRARSLLRLLTRRHVAFARGRFRLPAGNRPEEWDLIVANDVDLLPLVDTVAGPHTRVIFDAHEYAPKEFEDRFHWRLLHQPHKTWLCRRHLSRVHGMMTVCEGIADEYHRVFQVPRPVVVPNVPRRHAGEVRATASDRIRLVHHGLASRSRRIEGMIDAMRFLDRRFTLDLLLVPAEAGYLEFLRQRAAGDARIRFRAPVPTREIVAATCDYDVGVFLLPPTNLNYRFALPNKLFEFIQARLAIAIGPSPEMARVVNQHGLGIVTADFQPETLARALMNLDAAAIDRAKTAAHAAADIYCWERTRATLRDLVAAQLNSSCAA